MMPCSGTCYKCTVSSNETHLLHFRKSYPCLILCYAQVFFGGGGVWLQRVSALHSPSLVPLYSCEKQEKNYEFPKILWKYTSL